MLLHIDAYKGLALNTEFQNLMKENKIRFVKVSFKNKEFENIAYEFKIGWSYALKPKDKVYKIIKKHYNISLGHIRSEYVAKALMYSHIYFDLNYDIKQDMHNDDMIIYTNNPDVLKWIVTGSKIIDQAGNKYTVSKIVDTTYSIIKQNIIYINPNYTKRKNKRYMNFKNQVMKFFVMETSLENVTKYNGIINNLRTEFTYGMKLSATHALLAAIPDWDNSQTLKTLSSYAFPYVNLLRKVNKINDLKYPKSLTHSQLQIIQYKRLTLGNKIFMAYIDFILKAGMFMNLNYFFIFPEIYPLKQLYYKLMFENTLRQKEILVTEILNIYINVQDIKTSKIGWLWFMQYLGYINTDEELAKEQAKVLQKIKGKLIQYIIAPMIPTSVYGVAIAGYKLPKDTITLPINIMNKLNIKPLDWVLVVRYPVHTTNNVRLMKVYPDTTGSNAISINPEVMELMDGDFDGDRLAVYSGDIVTALLNDKFDTNYIEDIHDKYNVDQSKLYGIEPLKGKESIYQILQTKQHMKQFIGIFAAISRSLIYKATNLHDLRQMNKLYWTYANYIINTKNKFIDFDKLMKCSNDLIQDFKSEHSMIIQTLNGSFPVPENLQYIKKGIVWNHNTRLISIAYDLNMSDFETMLTLLYVPK